ncbi:hypothetical protein BGW36DRAFT_35322 [Talaromyces proteolyticus]|uniref:DUF3533 domain-containing protein n=1 Tax=Talaromyces proteolyticus TaxID=1131652 RepID=A0AAD4PX57_9EURO|nr:uncharacterized protein BGW36DRAFT_35322 [Talaromyces proteolyticus]KAH8693152.1 hypothetical protein BGW36DRAFT_35322 [Talaromyces proteolyticus]
MGSFHLLNISYEDAYNDVWEGHYWGAIIAMPNATHQLNLAIDDGSTLSNSSTAIAYIYNEARWPTTVEGFVIPSLRQAVSDTNSGYLQNYGVEKLSNANLSANGIEVLLNGLQAKAVNIYAVTLGIKYYLNTAGMVFPALIMFLYSMALSAAPSLIGPLSTRNDFLYRMVVVPIMSCVSGISWGLWYEAFHESPNGISGVQYCVIWLTFWMYALIAFLLYDIMVGAIPAAFYPPMVLVYIIINVTAAAFPIDLKPRFFHLDYVWPGYNCFELLITILSHGSTSRVYRNVPVLFGWLIVLWPLDTWANKRRSMADLA